MTVAYVGLGANLGEPRRQLQEAIRQVKELPDTRFVRGSGLYRSAPLGFTDQPDFLNAVVQIDTELGPDRLLARLQDIEDRQGRQRPFPGAPRTLDLDLLLHGDTVLSSPLLTLPHPRMHERAFVLAPLTEIAPAIAIPGHGPARRLLAACRDQIIEKID